MCNAAGIADESRSGSHPAVEPIDSEGTIVMGRSYDRFGSHTTAVMVFILMAILAPAAGAQPAASGGVEFELLTYNIKMLGLTANNNRERAERMISKLGGSAAKSDNFDVIVMQEAYTSASRKILLKGRATAPFTRKGGLLNAYGYEDSASKNGLLVISNWPIVTRKWGRFAHNPGGRIRGVLYTEINTDATRNFHVFSTHLWWDKKWSDNFPGVPTGCGGYELDQASRVKQLREMDDFIDSQNIPDGEPVLIAGDFNFGGPGDPRYEDCTGQVDVKSYAQLKDILEAQELTHVAADDHSEHWPGTTREETRTLDHIFHRNAPDLNENASYIERRMFTTSLDLGDGFRHNGRTHLSDHHPVLGHFVFDWGWVLPPPEEAQLPEEAKDWFGTYAGRNDGRDARLRIEPTEDGADLKITFQDLDRDTRLEGRVYAGDLTDSESHILEDLELTNGECTNWSEDECIRKDVERLFLHTWDKNQISGYADWKGTDYGMAFSKNGLSSAAGSGGRFDSDNWADEWAGTYRGRQDGRKAFLTIERDGARIHLTFKDLDRGDTFTGAVQNNTEPLHQLEDIRLTSRDGGTKVLDRLLLHTWDTNYISGSSQWQGTHYGNYFVRE